MKNIIATFTVASGALYLAMTGASFGQTALSSCNPATGLTPSGQQCVTLTPIEPTQYQTQISGAGTENYNPVNVGELADTYQCNPSGANADNNSALGGTLLIEDCGQPLDLDPATFKEFVGYSGAPAPAPAPVVSVPTPAPVAPIPAPPVVTPPLYAAVPFQAAGLSGTALAAGALGAAAVVGLIAIAANDDDDDGTPSTSTNGSN